MMEGTLAYFWIGLAGFLFFVISFFSIKIGLMITILSMLFSPEIPIGSLMFRPITIRLEDILIPVLLLAWLARISSRRDASLIRRSPLNKPILFVVGVMVFSTLMGLARKWVVPSEAILYLGKMLEFFAVFFLVLNYVETENQIRLYLFVALITVALLGFYTIFQVPHVEIFSEHRITAPFEGSPEPASVGGYMALLLLILFGLFLYSESTAQRWVYGIISLLVFIPFLYTLNRTSYAAFVGGVLFISIVARRKWIVVTLLLLALTSLVWLPASVKDRLAFTRYDAKNPGRIFGVDQSFQERITAVQRVWQQRVGASLILGKGVTSYYADNQYARFLNEIGIIGLGLWVWLFVRLFKMSRWLFESMPRGMFKGMVLGYRAGLIGILLHAFGAPTFYIIRIMEPFWFVTGLVVSLYLLRARQVQEAIG